MRQRSAASPCAASAGGWRVYSRPDYAPVVEKFLLDGQQAKLTQAALETLAVIAYRQPVSRGRVSAIRGVNVDGVIRTLLTRGLIEELDEAGEGGSILYGTTSYFLERMGLGSRSTSCRPSPRSCPRWTPWTTWPSGDADDAAAADASPARGRARAAGARGDRRGGKSPAVAARGPARPRAAGRGSPASTKPSQPTRLPRQQDQPEPSTSTTPTASGCRSCWPRPASGPDAPARPSSPPAASWSTARWSPSSACGSTRPARSSTSTASGSTSTSRASTSPSTSRSASCRR